MGQDRTTVRCVLVWVALLGTLGWAVTAAASGRDAFLPAALFALSTALLILDPAAAGIPWTERAPVSMGPNVHVPLILVRSSAWLLFAAEAAIRPLRLPAVGDLLTAAQAVAVVIASMVVSPYRDRVRTVRMALDGLVTTAAAVTAVGMVAFGGDADFRLDEPRALIGLALCFVVVLEVVTIGLVLVRDRTDHPIPAITTVALIGAAEIGIVLQGVKGGEREATLPLVVLWILGWITFVWSASLTRTRSLDRLGPDARDRGETAATLLATAIVVAAVVVGLLARGREVDLPGGTVIFGLVLASAALFAAREVFLGRVRVRLMAELRTQAGLDPLTGLANRRGLTAALDRIAGTPGDWAVLALDLDDFKSINDVHGHAAGDEVLVAVAAILRDGCPPGGLAARTGGDEFAVLCPGSVDDGAALGTALRAAVVEGLAGRAPGPTTTVSVGVGRIDACPGAPDRGDRLAALVEAAAALRDAKAHGGDRVAVYPGRVAESRVRRLRVEAGLREAIETGGLTTVAQPIVDLRTGEWLAVEALARWEDAALGTVSPTEFVAAAEESGMVGHLGRCVLEQSLAAYAGAGLAAAGVRLAVNVSPLELRTPDYVDGVQLALARHGLSASDLVVEVTEAVVVEASDPAVEVLRRLHALGASVAIDDFGVGYSALGYLRRLPVQVLKVDRVLLAEALITPRTRALLAGVVDLARRVDLPVIVEGIEDEAGAALAAELGVSYGQGYWLGVPVPWADLPRHPATTLPRLSPATPVPAVGPAARPA